MLLKSFRDLRCCGRENFVIATDVDIGPEELNNRIPGTRWVTEANAVLLGFDDGDMGRGYAKLDRSQVVDLAKFLLRCASMMDDEE